MGLFNVFLNYGKARMMRRMLGGPLGTTLMVAWLGKKAFHYYQRRKGVRAY